MSVTDRSERHASFLQSSSPPLQKRSSTAEILRPPSAICSALTPPPPPSPPPSPLIPTLSNASRLHLRCLSSSFLSLLPYPIREYPITRMPRRDYRGMKPCLIEVQAKGSAVAAANPGAKTLPALTSLEAKVDQQMAEWRQVFFRSLQKPQRTAPLSPWEIDGFHCCPCVWCPCLQGYLVPD